MQEIAKLWDLYETAEGHLGFVQALGESTLDDEPAVFDYKKEIELLEFVVEDLKSKIRLHLQAEGYFN